MRVFNQASGGSRAAASRRASRASLADQQACPQHAPLLRCLTGNGRSFRLASHHGRLEVELSSLDVQAAVAATAPPPDASVEIDCLGLAQAMIDFAAAVDEDMLAGMQVEKGSRRLISVQGRAELLSQLEGREYAISAGGSLSNTLMALARLGDASQRLLGEAPLRVAMSGLVGSDPLGEFYCAQMRQAGVEVVSPPLAGANTGTVVVLTSQDAQRTMLSYLGTAAEVAVDAALEAAISRSRVLVVEGYLWELPNAAATISKAIAAAQRAGCVVAMTAGDAGVVERHHEEMWQAIDQGIDLLFTNAGEAAALLRYEPAADCAAATAAAAQPASAAAGAPAQAAAAKQQHCATGEQLALRLGPHCSVVVVTDGDRGSYMTALGQLHCVPPCWMETAPVDTCGAGDAYAAGLLYGYLRHYDLVTMGRTAARVATAVISKHGAALSAEAAAALMEALPATGKGARRSPSAATLAPSTPRLA